MNKNNQEKPPTSAVPLERLVRLYTGFVMREIKFRGISLRKNSFIYGGILRANERRGNCLAIKDTICNINNGKIDLIPGVVFPETVGQFTGIIDKNGKEIYEGDILRVLMTDWPSKLASDHRTLDEYKNDLSDVYVVGFENGAFSMSLNNNGDFNHYIFCGTHGFIEIVGNIHENPELLKDA